MRQLTPQQYEMAQAGNVFFKAMLVRYRIFKCEQFHAMRQFDVWLTKRLRMRAVGK